MDGTTLSAIASAVLSLGFSYIPGLKNWYNQLGQGEDGSDDGGTRKRLVMLVLLVLVVLAVFGLTCAGLGSGFELNVTCDKPGAMGLVKALVMAVAANQGTYMLTRRPKVRPATHQLDLPF
jgi:TRAP-type mannitol/chloroaromatic compound transport system permease large subunit